MFVCDPPKLVEGMLCRAKPITFVPRDVKQSWKNGDSPKLVETMPLTSTEGQSVKTVTRQSWWRPFGDTYFIGFGVDTFARSVVVGSEDHNRW